MENNPTNQPDHQPEKRRQANKLETQSRIRTVQEWILQDHTSADIVKQATQLWEISDRQAYRIMWAANRFFQERDRRSLQGKIAYYLARKKKLLRDMTPEEKKTAAGVAAVNRVLDSMAKLEGVTVDTIKVIGDPDKPLRTESKVTQLHSTAIDYSKLPTEFLEMIVLNRKSLN